MYTEAELLKSIPGAAKALAELVQEAELADKAFISIGTARANQIAQGISDETAARTKIAKALAGAGVGRIADNKEEFGQRAIEHFAQKIVQHQTNREAVTLLALQQLADDPPSDPPKEVPADDWLNLFGSFAERASSQTMREHWAQILNGEIRKPGSFSLVTLQMASILDHKLASIIEKVCPWIIDGLFVPSIGHLRESAFYADLLTLDGIGFLRVNAAARFFIAGPQGHIKMRLKNRTIWAVGAPGTQVTIPVAQLTLAGTELLTVISYESDPGLEVLLSEPLEEQGFKIVHQIEPIEPEVPIIPERPIWERVAAIGAAVPTEAWNEVPTDLAANVDWYLYGAKKGSH